jgi:hypothetical protein
MNEKEKTKKKRLIANPDDPKTLAAHKLSLARDLLDDVELSRLSPEQLLLKAFRLARLVEEEDTCQWINFELHGYPNTDLGLHYMTEFNRWTDKSKQTGYWIPLANICAWAAARQTEIQQLRVPDINVSLSSSNPHEIVTGYIGSNVDKASQPVNEILRRLNKLSQEVAKYREIQSHVLVEIHSFAMRTYYRLAFSNAAESIFRDYQLEIDILLRSHARDVIEKIPAITSRLAEGDAEAISQALNSCRRMIKAFADTMEPGQEKDIDVDGEKYNIGSDKVLNRIQYFMTKKCTSKGRRERLSRNLRSIWDRASAGAHADVTNDEASALFLQTYLALGEVLKACTDGLAG